MRKLIIIFSIIISSCSQDDSEGPKLSKDQMVNIMIEIHLAEGKVSQTRMPLDSSLSYFLYMQREIFKRNQVDSADYVQSMNYYSENIKELDKIYEAVLDSLNLMSTDSAMLERYLSPQ